MAQTVGQHALAAFVSPVNGTSPIDANQVRGNDNTIRTAYNSHDSDSGVHFQSSTFANRPAPGTVGRKWMTVDDGASRIWYDTGTVWVEYPGERAFTAISEAYFPLIPGNYFDIEPDQNRMYAIPFIVDSLISVDRIGITVNTADSTGSVRLGVYESSAGLPSSLLIDAGTVSITTTGNKEITISQTLLPGLYFLAAVGQSINGNGRVVGVGGVTFQMKSTLKTSVPFANAGGYYGDGVSGALPSVFGVPTNSGFATFVFLRAV